MLFNLTKVLKDIQKGPLATLELTGAYIGPSTVGTDGLRPVNLSAENKFLWEALINNQGKYEKTWKLPLPENATDVTIAGIVSSLDNKLIVFGTCNLVSMLSWVMILDRQGKCLTSPSFPSVNGVIKQTVGSPQQQQGQGLALPTNKI